MLDQNKLSQRLKDITQYAKDYFELQSRGLTLSKMERRRLATLEKRLLLIFEPEERSDLLVDVHTISRFFRVTVRQVQHWSKARGCPKLKHGLYDLRAVQDWYLDNILGSDSREIQDIKLEYWRAKAESERLRVDQAKGRVYPLHEVIEQWTLRILELKSGLLNFKDRLTGLLAGKDVAEMRSIIEGEVWLLLDSYAREGRYCMPEEAQPQE